MNSTPMTDPGDTGAPNAPPDAARTPGARLSVLSGDRPCIRCGFNLTGQHVLREPHYGMLVVMCPECGTPASLQEYPLLGKWAARWGAVFAAMWVLFVLALLACSAGVSFGFGVGATESSGEKFAQYIAEREFEWFRTPEAERRPPATVQSAQYIASALQQGPSPYTAIDDNWWSAQDPKALLAQSGGWWRSLDLNVVYVWAGACIPLFVLGVVWSVVLAHVRRWRLWLVIPAVLVCAGALAVLVWSVDGTNSRWAGQWQMAIQKAREFYFIPVIALTLGAEVIPLAVGLLFGRPLARTMVRAFVPPRLRAPLSFLWICDGKPLPRPAR